MVVVIEVVVAVVVVQVIAGVVGVGVDVIVVIEVVVIAYPPPILFGLRVYSNHSIHVSVAFLDPPARCVMRLVSREVHVGPRPLRIGHGGLRHTARARAHLQVSIICTFV